MPELSFFVEGAAPIAYAAVPQLEFKLRIQQSGEERQDIHSIALHCQIRIEPTRRGYGTRSRARLQDLFGAPDRWSRTMRSMLWTHADVMVPPFTDRIVASLPVPCSYDFNIAATKYFDGLDEGEIPLSLLFSGTVFYRGEDGGLQVAQVPWDKEARFRLPVGVWRTMMDHYYPNSAWLCVRRDLFDALADYKTRQGLATWEQALESLLSAHSDNANQPLAFSRSVEAPP